MPRGCSSPGDAGQGASNPGPQCVGVEVVTYGIVQLHLIETECCEVLSPASGSSSLVWAGYSVSKPRAFVVYLVHYRAHPPFFVISHLSSEKDPV